MNPEIKAKWIEALRSGKYKQTRAHLKDAAGHCCLGVLCEVVGEAPTENDGRWFYGGCRNYPPSSVYEKAGLGDQAHELPTRVLFGGEEHGHLANLNDAGADFNFIADVIEKQL